jgi:hypothetical protein
MLWIILLLTLLNTAALVLLIWGTYEDDKIRTQQHREIVKRFNELEFRVNSIR